VPLLLGTERVLAPSDQQLLPASTIRDQIKSGICVIGSGWSAYQTELEQQLSNCLIEVVEPGLPDALTALLLSKSNKNNELCHEPSAAVPVYLRNNVAAKSTKF
jgi:tRNA A37 threonylcarbamoyladenosine modification protein TsaB